VRMSAKELAEHFSELEDPRCSGKVEHLLIDILVIAVCAVIAAPRVGLTWRSPRPGQTLA
jgi:DDE_Tnp_1-associated